MSLKNRFFVFSDTNLRYKEITHFKAKVLGSALLSSVLGLLLLLGANHVFGDFLGIGYDRLSTMTLENRTLKDQLKDLSRRMEAVQSSLEKLNAQGNDLRLMVDLAAIDDDTRAAAIGGASTGPGVTLVSRDASDLLVNANRLIDQLTREVRLQQSSYEEIYRRYEFNKKFFAHLPAIKPMAGYYSLHGFGMRVHPVLRVYRMHEGIDIIQDVGTEVYAAGNGTVRYAGRTQGGYGTVVEISHGFGYSTLYAHLSKVLVRPGQTVKRGELIAKSGRSGLVSGPHLHYEVRYNGRKQNPVDYFFDDVDPSRYRALLAEVK